MKKVLLWIAIGVVGTLVLLAGIGYVFGPKPKELVKVESTKKMDRLGQLNETLASHNLTLCEVYKWVGTMELQAQRDLEAKHPEMNAVDRIQRIDQVRAEKWEQYRSTHQLPDSIKTAITVYGLQECD